jgi:hypothetical protein
VEEAERNLKIKECEVVEYREGSEGVESFQLFPYFLIVADIRNQTQTKEYMDRNGAAGPKYSEWKQ